MVYPGKPKPSFQAKPKPGFPGKPRLGFPGKEIPKKKQKKVVSETDTSNGEDTNPEQSKSTPQDDHDEPDDHEVEKTTRKSTRTAVVVRQAERAERDATRAALQATMKVDHDFYSGPVFFAFLRDSVILTVIFVFLAHKKEKGRRGEEDYPRRDASRSCSNRFISLIPDPVTHVGL